MLRQTLHAGLFLALVGLLSGCGPNVPGCYKCSPAEGTILYKGKRAQYVVVRFVPVGRQGAEAIARTNKGGRFALWTYSNEGPDGAVPGKYRVTIAEHNPDDVSSHWALGRLPKGAQPTKIGAPVTLSQVVEIKPEVNELPLEFP
jgi:hypothetical protein